MITYIFKTILCSAILLLGYYLLLEREKIYRFNRVFLLFSIVFSFIIPLVTINIESSVQLISEVAYQPNYILQNTVIEKTLPSVNESFNLDNFLFLAYMAVTTFLFCRLLVNLFTIFYKIKINSPVPYLDAKIVLTKDNRVAHSFFNYIFIYNEDFEKGTIENEIFEHELAHIKQKHSADILFIELIKIFAWINPLLYFYRKAIQLNHEFLADEFVLNRGSSTQYYQLLLLNKAMRPSDLVLSNSFNYIQIKKRIIMMSKKTSLKVAILKQIALIPIIVAAGFLFTTKVTAQIDLTVQNQQQKESKEFKVVEKLDSTIPSSKGIRMPRPDKTGKEWWQLVAYDRRLNYDIYNKYGEIVILGQKSINNEIESYNDIVALAGGKDNNGKGNDVIVIIHSETASYNIKSKELFFKNCKVEEWPLDSFHQEPLKSYTLKTLGIEISAYAG